MYDYRTFVFGRGSHETREQGVCIMEAVAWLAGLPHSDHPECASPVITDLAIWLNDSCNDELRQELLRDLPWRIVGTKSTREIEQQRAFMAADWAVRFVCPFGLRAIGRTSDAERLESLPVVDSVATAKQARDAANAAYAAAYAAATRANAAANAAAKAAVLGPHVSCRPDPLELNAARYAANAAAKAADLGPHVSCRPDPLVLNAARYAAAAAANTAANLETIQRSCAELLDRMIRLTEPQEQVIGRTLCTTSR